MAPSPFPQISKPAAATNSDGFSCFLSNKTVGMIHVYHAQDPGV